MPDKPAAEILLDAALIRDLLAEQADHAVPDAASRPLVKVAEGWDSEVWRLGDDLAVRLPRRAAAAPLVANEQRVLPDIGRRFSASGVRVPAPLVRGRPTAAYPWPWSVVPWIPGRQALDVPRSGRSVWAPALADALRRLHVPAPDDFPVNPVRGRPLATRDAIIRERLAALLDGGMVDDASARTLLAAWQEGLSAAPWPSDPVWIHGDLHPGNLVVEGDALAGIIDFGDVTAGDPAYDFAVAWLAFDEAGRNAFVAAVGTAGDPATWRRARGWAAAVVVLLLTHSDDAPAYGSLAREALGELAGDDGE